MENETKTKDNIIEIEKDVLKSLIARMENLEKDNEMLKFSADKGRVSRYEMMNQQDLIRTAKVSFLKDDKGILKAIVAWRTVQDDVFIDVNGIYREDQVIEVFFEDKKSSKIRYVDFARLVEKIEGEIIEKKQTKEGEIYKIQMKDGKEYDLDIKFIN